MKIYVKYLLIFFLANFANLVYSGELIYRDGFGGRNCSVSADVAEHTTDHGNGLITTTTTIKTLACSGKIIAKHTSVCTDGWCSSKRVIVNDAYDFNFNIPGRHQNDVIFGSVSVKSQANVFAQRNLSQHYLAYSNDGILDKPVIFVEGYDPKNQTFPEFYYHRGIGDLVYGGRDLIVVNFPDGAKDTDANALFLQSIIEETNSNKIGDSPLAVIGYSMGGIVARKALKRMELMGLQHNTSLYVSYDSPHVGANFPSALRDTIEGLVAKLDSATSGYTSSSLKRAQKYYKSDAARQMLIGSDHLKVPTINDFPENLARVAITSGSMLGSYGAQANSVNQNQMIAAFKFYLYYSSGGWAFPSSSLSDDFTWYSRGIDGVYYDNVAGSYSNIFRESYLELKAGADRFKPAIEAQSSNITFIPTASSLAMRSAPQIPVIDNFKYDSPFDQYIAVNPITGIEPCFAFDSQNAVGENIPHNPGDETFNHNQLAQLKCAMSKYHVAGAVIPNRFLKIGRAMSTALIMIPINHSLLL